MTTTRPVRIALIGVGKIARDQHLPALRDTDAFELVATADPNGGVEDVPSFSSIDALLASDIAMDAVSVCMPPKGRAAVVRQAIDAGLHVMLEKPPAATLTEVEALRAQATAANVALFATWHSREAGGVAPARAWLADKRIDRVAITWAEDIGRWHPGQDWILAAGGFGVFDPGINGLSIATAILPHPLVLEGAAFETPSNREAPIAATLRMTCGTAAVTASFDFLHAGEPRWDIEFEAEGERLTLREGGHVLELAGETERGLNAEYPRLYARFAELVARRAHDVDITSLRLVADAFLTATVRAAPAFEW